MTVFFKSVCDILVGIMAFYEILTAANVVLNFSGSSKVEVK